MPHYYKDIDITEDTDSDVTWTMQEVASETVDYDVDYDVNGHDEVHQPKTPVGYPYMTEGNEIKKKKKKKKKIREEREKPVHRRPKTVVTKRTKKVEANKDLGYGLGLSRGFSLWRTLKDMRHCITRVSNPLTKAQRRSLRRKLSYYVDDLERIVVGVNPRAPVTEAEEVVSGDEEMREEVNALIEDALDEAALQGKIVQSGYFETRMSYLEQQCAALKKRLEEVAEQKSVREEEASKELLLENHQGSRKGDGPKKRKVEVENDESQDIEQMDKQQEVSKKSPSVYSSLCSLQAAVISRHSNDGSDESNSEEDGVNEAEKERTSANGKGWNQKQTEKKLTQEEQTPGDEEDFAHRIRAEVSGRPENKPFKGWGLVVGPNGKGDRREKHVPHILKRINLEY